VSISKEFGDPSLKGRKGVAGLARVAARRGVVGREMAEALASLEAIEPGRSGCPARRKFDARFSSSWNSFMIFLNSNISSGGQSEKEMGVEEVDGVRGAAVEGV
jgi:hypothetical protein